MEQKTDREVKEDADTKREVALMQERKILSLLEQLKVIQDPFTNAEEMQEYLDDLKIE